MKISAIRWIGVGGALCGLLIGNVYAQQGGWSASVTGPSFGYRGAQLSSSALLPPTSLQVPADGTVTSVHWRYQLAQAAPIDLDVQLCAANRCTRLDSGSGQTYALQGIPANSTFQMVFSVPGSGRMATPVEVLTSEISVNYR
ncbi:flagellar protein FlhE [Dickeya lacustris]|uniref:Flagellar protein FlhE n=1 Tax=Dickeya lacustris TaxID=2259638 RepID=A0ABY8GCH8_9GAMM|nr:flagellar protein FlhE [Dickeya lacustris]WFN57534.1 flagellar protein FlhE [Dickeya lacustris]